jgi:hypothetical protein
MRPGDSEEARRAEFERKIREIAGAEQESPPAGVPLCGPHHDDVALSERERKIFAALVLAWRQTEEGFEMTSPTRESAGSPLMACLVVAAAGLLGVFFVLASFLAEAP